MTFKENFKRSVCLLFVLLLSTFMVTPISVAHAQGTLRDHIEYRVEIRYEIIVLTKSIEGKSQIDPTITKSIRDKRDILSKPWAVYTSINSLQSGISTLSELYDKYDVWFDITGSNARMRMAIEEEKKMVQDELARLKQTNETIPFNNLKNPVDNVGGGVNTGGPTGSGEQNGTPGVELDLSGSIPVVKEGTPATGGTEKKKPETGEKFVAGIFRSFADFLFDFLKPDKSLYGFDLDTLIFNQSHDFRRILQVDNTSSGGFTSHYVQTGFISQFKVDFSDDQNSFALMGKTVFMITQAIALVGMYLILMLKGGQMMLSQTSSSRLSFKEILLNYVLSFGLIMVMPFVIDFLLYLVNDFVSSLIPEQGFLNIIRSGEDIGSAIFYLASVLLSVYYLFVYAARAWHITMFYFMFPIMSMYLNGAKFRKSFDSFLSDFIVCVLEQPFDAILFWSVTLFFPEMNLLVKLIIIATLIPARGLIKRWLGITSGSLKGDLLGFAAVTSAVSLAKGFATGTKDFIGGVSGGAEDIANANRGQRMYRGNMFAPENAGMAMAGAGGAGMSPLQMAGMPMSGRNPMSSVFSSPVAGWTEKGGINIDNFGKVMPQTPDEAAQALRSRGMDKIKNAVTKAGTGITGSAIGGAMGAGFGVQGMMIGANIGGTLGSSAGDIAAELRKYKLDTSMLRGLLPQSAPVIEEQPISASTELAYSQGSSMSEYKPEGVKAKAIGIEENAQSSSFRRDFSAVANFSTMPQMEKDQFINEKLQQMDPEIRSRLEGMINTASEQNALEFSINYNVDNEGFEKAKSAFSQFSVETNVISSVGEGLKQNSPASEQEAIGQMVNNAHVSLQQQLSERLSEIGRNHNAYKRSNEVDFRDLI